MFVEGVHRSTTVGDGKGTAGSFICYAEQTLVLQCQTLVGEVEVFTFSWIFISLMHVHFVSGIKSVRGSTIFRDIFSVIDLLN